MTTSLGDPLETWILVPQSIADSYEYKVDEDSLFQDLANEDVTLDELGARRYLRYNARPCTSCNDNNQDGDVFLSMSSTIRCKECMAQLVASESLLVFKAGLAKLDNILLD